MESDNETTSFTVGSREGAITAAALELRYAYRMLGLEVPIETPLRVARWLAEYVQEDHELIHNEWVKTFESSHSEMVVVQDLSFVSLCEHHLLPFRGKAAIGYIPNGKLLGLSKFGRLLHQACQRPTLQEDITTVVADSIDKALSPLGVAVMLYDVEHACMTTRGIKDPCARATTNAVRGVFLDNTKQSRDEFMAIALQGRN